MSCKYCTIELYEKLFIEKYPNSDIKILEFVENLHIKIKNKYGICKANKSELLKNGTISIQAAVNKNEYFINQAKEIHGDKYDYSLLDYKNYKYKIKIICKDHGIFQKTPGAHLQKYGCPKCGREKIAIKSKMSLLQFIKKANLIHKNKYSYSKTDYKNSTKPIKIICPIHDEFEQRAAHHLAGHGCRKCKNKLISENIIKNPTGWNYSNWEKSSKKAKNFDSFKVYILECWNNEEHFYKIGKTFQTVEKRFHSTILPYNYKIIKIYEGTARKISELEKELQMKNRENKYIPKIKFNGMQECFNKINETELELLRETIKQL